MKNTVKNTEDSAVEAGSAVQADDTRIAEKAAYWFNTLLKCARLLDVDVEESIPQGVLDRVTKLVAATHPAEPGGAPIPMILHCPQCHVQHIDAPDERTPGWKNEPHRSHLCHACGNIWRPADVATEGVRTIQAKGGKDSAEPAVGDALVAKGEPLGYITKESMSHLRNGASVMAAIHTEVEPDAPDFFPIFATPASQPSPATNTEAEKMLAMRADYDRQKGAARGLLMPPAIPGA